MTDTQRVPWIAVVEDSDVDYLALSRAVKRSGLSVRLNRCADATQLDQLLDDMHGHTPPSFVLLDLNLPGIDGRQILRKLKTSELKHIPVVIYSTSDDESDISYCYSHYANAYHVKPFEFTEMCELVERILSYWLDVPTWGSVA